MNDDLWVTTKTAELVSNILLRGSLPLIEIDLAKKREKEIQHAFINRFGNQRAKMLLLQIAFIIREA